MADHSSEAQNSDSVVSQETANSSEETDSDVTNGAMTANTSVGSDARLTLMTGVYEAEFVLFRAVPLLYRSGAYSRKLPEFKRSIP